MAGCWSSTARVGVEVADGRGVATAARRRSGNGEGLRSREGAHDLRGLTLIRLVPIVEQGGHSGWVVDGEAELTMVGMAAAPLGEVLGPMARL